MRAFPGRRCVQRQGRRGGAADGYASDESFRSGAAGGGRAPSAASNAKPAGLKNTPLPPSSDQQAPANAPLLSSSPGAPSSEGLPASPTNTSLYAIMEEKPASSMYSYFFPGVKPLTPVGGLGSSSSSSSCSGTGAEGGTSVAQSPGAESAAATRPPRAEEGGSRIPKSPRGPQSAAAVPTTAAAVATAFGSVMRASPSAGPMAPPPAAALLEDEDEGFMLPMPPKA